MPFSEFALQLAGAVTLLIYAIRMVRTGFERACGAAFRVALLKNPKSPFAKTLSGVGIAALLQSGTATALLTVGLVVSGALPAAAGLAVILGADLGSAIAAGVFSLNIQIAVPALMTIGGALFMRQARVSKHIGRIILGIAFVLLSLRLIGEAADPLRDSDMLRQIASSLHADPLAAVFIGALIAFAFHSSVAAILFFAAIAAQRSIPVENFYNLVLGANIGGSMIAFWLTRGGHVVAHRLIVANVGFRCLAAGVVFAMPWILVIPIDALDPLPEHKPVLFHLGFNLLAVIIFFPFLQTALACAERLVPAAPDSATPPPATALNEGDLSVPGRAIAGITRELLRMSDQIEFMISPIMSLFRVANHELSGKIRKADRIVNRIHNETKLYIARLSKNAMTDEEARQCVEFTEFCVNLERAGDIVAKELLPLSHDITKNNLSFSDEGWKELTHLHCRVVANIQLALNVLVSEDVDSARQLVEEKERMRKLERNSHDRHLVRLRGGNAESIATSDIHLEIVRALKEINSRYSAFAYPILDKYGVLLDSRLTERLADPS